MTWLPGYAYRKSIPLTGGIDGELTDYQLDLAISFVTDHMQNDFDDLRFTQADGTTLIDAWLRDKTDGTSADVVVEFPGTPADGVEETEGYMYYGKADAVNYWDADATFLLFDDFDTDLSKWTVEKEGSASAIVELDGSGNLHLAGEDSVISSGNAKSIATFTNGFLVELKRKYSDDHYVDASIGDGVIQDMDNGGTSAWWHTCQGDGYMWMQQSLIKHKERKTPSGASSILLAEDTSNTWGALNTYETLNFIYDANGVMKWLHNGTEILSATDTTYLSSSKYLLLSQGEYSSGDGGDQYVDLVLVRKYTANPPTYTFGSEESAPAGGLTILDFERAEMRGVMRGVMRGAA